MNSGGGTPRAALIVVTPAHNEQATLDALANSMMEQTVWPDRWVIVNDRSQDNTAIVAAGIAERVPFAETVSISGRDPVRNFAGKVGAFATGYERFVEPDRHSYVACVDADVLLPDNYFERILKEFEARPQLGVAGGVYVDPLGRVGRHGGGSVPGPAQVFRRVTFDEMEGFRPLPRGGEDALACTYARRNGWISEVFADVRFRHLRSQGTGGGRTKLRAAFDHGRQDWDVGMDPVFEVVRMAPRLFYKPYGLAVLARLAGYAYGAVRRTRQVDDDIMRFSRAEQRERLWDPVDRRFPAARQFLRRVPVRRRVGRS